MATRATSIWLELTARLPLASLDLGCFPFWLLALIYAALTAWVWWLNQPGQDEETRPHWALPVLDSRQGDAILITLPNGRQLLIDSGSSATKLYSKRIPTQ